MSCTILNEELIFYHIIIKLIILHLKSNKIRYFNHIKNFIIEFIFANIIILSKIKFKKDL